MTTKIVTPRELPLTLLEMRDHLKLDDPGQVNELDALILARADAACDFAQHYAQRAIGKQTLELVLPSFPRPCWRGGIGNLLPVQVPRPNLSAEQVNRTALVLPYGPVAAVASVQYTDTTGAVQTYAPANYALDDYGIEHRLMPAYGVPWPLTRWQWDAVKVRYECGYTAATLPGAVRSALLLILGHLHENNQAVSSLKLKLEEIPLGAVNLLDTVRSWSL